MSFPPLSERDLKQEPVETAQLTVVDAKQTEEPVKVASEQPVVASRDKFFHMGGSSDEEAPEDTSLAVSGAETGYKAGSQISDLRERFLICVCLAIAGLIGFGIRRRFSLRLSSR